MQNTSLQSFFTFGFQGSKRSEVIQLSIASPTSFSKVVSYIYNAFRIFCHILHSILRSADLLNDFLIAYIKVYSIHCKVLLVLTKAWCHILTMTLSYNSFTVLKISLVLHLLYPPSHLEPVANHQSFKCMYNFAFSRLT